MRVQKTIVMNILMTLCDTVITQDSVMEISQCLTDVVTTKDTLSQPTVATTNSIPFASLEAWQWLLHFCIIAIGLLAGNILRRKVPVLKKSLIPSALLGGALLLCLKAIPGMENIVNKESMEIITYHALGLGFVALALKNNKIQSKSSTMTVIETGTLTASTYLIQAIVGLGATILLFYFGKQIFYASGLLLPMGYGQGPGQALNFGTMYTAKAGEQGIDFAGADFGLAIATLGFIVGSIVGVVYLNILRRKGVISVQEEDRQTNTLEDYQSKDEIPDSESIDKFSIQICLVLFVYFLVYLFVNSIQKMDLGNFGENTLKPMLWGFNFLFGTLFGVIAKWLINKFKKVKLMSREYTNNYLLNRISGFCFDVMIVAGTAAISFKALKAFIIPLTIVCVLGAIATFWYLRAASKHLYPTYVNEGFLSMFGMLTGTASNGMILLREIDPKFETPAANNLVLQTFPAIVLGFPIMLILGYAPQSFQASIITLIVVSVLFLIMAGFIFRKKIFKRKKK